jgi:hypothetical protein
MHLVGFLEEGNEETVVKTKQMDCMVSPKYVGALGLSLDANGQFT